MKNINFRLLRLVVLALLLPFLCSGTKANSYISAPMNMVPGWVHGMFYVRNINELLADFGGDSEKFQNQISQIMKDAPYSAEELKKMLIAVMGFDPLSPASYRDRGLSVTRPLAIVFPSLQLSEKPEVMILIPVDDRKKFEIAICDMFRSITKARSGSLSNETPKITSETINGITMVYWEETKLALFDYIGGYARVARFAGTLRALKVKNIRDSMAFETGFTESSRSAPANPRYWAYINGRVLKYVRSEMEKALDLEGGSLRDWFSETPGFLLALSKDKTEWTSYFSMPAPAHPRFSKIFESRPDLGNILKELPPNPDFMAKMCLNYNALFQAVREVLLENGHEGKETLDDMEKAKFFGDDVKFKNLLEQLGSGALFSAYVKKDFPKPLMWDELGDQIDYFLAIPIVDPQKTKETIIEIAGNIEEDEKKSKQDDEKEFKFEKIEKDATFFFVEDLYYERMRDQRYYAKSNLNEIITNQENYYKSNKTYAKSFEELKWKTHSRKDPYSYFMNSCETVYPSKISGNKECPAELKEWFAKPCDKQLGCVRAGAVANIDSDAALDIWASDWTFGNKIERVNLSSDTKDGTPHDGPPYEILFGVKNSNFILTNNREFIDRDKDRYKGASAYDTVVSSQQIKTLENPNANLYIAHLWQWKELLLNLKSGYEIEEKENKKAIPFEVKFLEGIFIRDKLSSVSLNIQGDSLVFKGQSGAPADPLFTLIEFIGIPEFFRFYVKSAQNEVKINLAALAESQKIYLEKNKVYATSIDQLGWKPEGRTRYSYYLSCNTLIPSTESNYKECPEALKKSFDETCCPPKGKCKKDETCFRAGAAANLDSDPDFDIWLVGDGGNPWNISKDSLPSFHWLWFF